MGDVLLSCFRASLPDELASVLEDHIQQIETGNFLALLKHPDVLVLLGRDDDTLKDVKLKDFPLWSDYIFHRLGKYFSTSKRSVLLLIVLRC